MFGVSYDSIMILCIFMHFYAVTTRRPKYAHWSLACRAVNQEVEVSNTFNF